MRSPSRIQFGHFELDVESGELWKRGRKVKLAPQPARLLGLLANSSGCLVTRESIKRQLWGEGTFIDFEHGLNFCIRKIRAALCDSAKRPKYIETLPPRGYRFIAPTTAIGNGGHSNGDI